MSEKLEKEILQEVLTPAMVNEIWTTNYTDAIAFTLQDFSVGALLPAVFYMFRRGYRRGQGNFADRYKPLPDEVETERGRNRIAATVASVARVLSADQLHFAGFESPLAQNVLADFLLTHCLENQRHESGRKKAIVRAFPTHYQAAWMDLPAKVSDLRLVPESLVAILAGQATGESIVSDDSKKTFFRVKDDFSENILLSVFGAGMSAREKQSDLVDEFDESVQMGLDQLATIRVARNCDQPLKLKESGMVKKLGEGRGSSQIGNQHPIARQAARMFREDIRLFLQAFGTSVPRQSLTQMLESIIGLGLTNTLLSTANAIFHWEATGQLPGNDTPWALMVDCSGNSDQELRRLSEETMDDTIRRLHRLPVVFMALRVLEWHARHEIRDLPARRPDSTERISILGDIMFERHEESRQIMRDVRKSCITLAEKFEQSDTGEEYRRILEEENAIPNPIWRLAEAVTQMMGDSLQVKHIIDCLSSCMMTGQSNGLAIERRVQFQTMRNGKKTGMMKSVVLTDTMLDMLVHRHLRKAAKGGDTKSHSLSFNEFVQKLKDRYGLFVDQAPPGKAVSRELLQRNRRFLERRLRSLGLLMGVNDAESMKRLKSRFTVQNQGDVSDG